MKNFEETVNTAFSSLQMKIKNFEETVVTFVKMKKRKQMKMRMKQFFQWVSENTT